MTSITKPYIVCDIDGVLADNSHRLNYILTPFKKDWEEYDRRAPYDTLYESIAEILNLFWVKGYTIIMLTGRNERTRKDTKLWLDQHGIPWSELLMRSTNDRRPASEVKKEILKEQCLTPKNVLCLFEDEPKTIKTLREEGFTVLDPKGWEDSEYSEHLHTGGRDNDDSTRDSTDH